MRKRMLAAGLAAAALSLAGAGTATAAAPRAASCGATLTTDGYLPRDLHCAAGQGITLAGDVTLDLRGHRLAGPGRSADHTSTGRGVSVVSGSPAVVDGTIQGWDAGIGHDDAGEFGTEVAVRGVRFTGNYTGVSADQMSATLDRVTATGNDSGAQGFLGALTITRSVLRDNGTGAGISEGHLSISGSQLVNNGYGASCFDNCDLDDSRIAGNRSAGVYAFLATAKLTGNEITGNGFGYQSGEQDSPVLVGNRFSRNEIGVGVDYFSTSTVRDNTFTGNGKGVTATGIAEGYGITLTGNTFSRNGDGVFLPEAVDTSISLGGNRAVRNTGWGLYAPGATDLGGNTARGNGNEPQCVGVSC